MTLLKTIFYYPLLNLLVFLYGFIGNFGFAIIIVTLLVRVALFHFTKSGIVAQRRMSNLQPELKKIQEKHKDNKGEQSKAVMEFYKANNVNPFSGLLPMIIQMPVLISLYYVFLKGIHSVGAQDLYSFVSFPGNFDFSFLGFFDLAHPSKILAALAGVSQFFQSKYTMANQKVSTAEGFATAMNYQMMYFFPILTFLIGLSLPAGLALYWIVGAIFSIIQQIIIEKYYLPKK